MNKNEKEIAALYLSACLDEMRIAAKCNNDEAYQKASEDYKRYNKKLRDMLEMKFEMFGLDYQKSVRNPLNEVAKIVHVFYSQRVNGEQLKYPA